jgi:hypothetical protein
MSSSFSWRLIAALLAVAAPFMAAAQEPRPGREPRPLVQIALLLDTSGSMSGLIDQAKAQLWKVVNELATARRGGARPDLRIALYEYGNDALPERGNWIRQISPLTDDLDRVSEQLFALTTNGGSEYCGAVIERAVGDLQWSSSPEDLKLIFIAGNEPFTQGPVDFRGAVKKAAEKGIAVNTIHCGSEAEGVATGWRDGAALADGTFMTIDHGLVAADLPTPHDAELAQLNERLNRTYLAYGPHGQGSRQRQSAQDANAAKMSAGSLAARAVSKASKLYRNSGWDLVDAASDGMVKVEELKAEDLPEPMRKMTPAERKAFVEGKGKERAEVQKLISELSRERSAFLAKEQAKRAGAAADTLDAAMIKAVHAQAARKRYTFD